MNPLGRQADEMRNLAGEDHQDHPYQDMPVPYARLGDLRGSLHAADHPQQCRRLSLRSSRSPYLI